VSESSSPGARDERRATGPATDGDAGIHAGAGVAPCADATQRADRSDDPIAAGRPVTGGKTAAIVDVGRGRGRWRRDRGAGLLAGAGVVLVLAASLVGVRAAAGTGDDGEPPIAGAASSAPSDPAERPSAGPTAVAGVATGPPGASWGPVSNQSPVAAPTTRAAAGTRPLGVRVPAIGVDATSLVPLAILPATGELAAPADFDQTGWYAAGPVPGEPGPAVIAAHVDSKAGPAVFFRLKELKPGDKVYVPRSDRVTVTFTVTGVERYPKNAFPTQKVHGPTPDRALRLITCGGSFDYAKRSYRDNIVVYAVRTG
jgi:LPXTG-site transpeptidase (sortase) family protein